MSTGKAYWRRATSAWTTTGRGAWTTTLRAKAMDMGRSTRRIPTEISQSVGRVVGHLVNVESEIGRDVIYATQLFLIDRDVIHSVKLVDHNIIHVIQMESANGRDVIHATLLVTDRVVIQAVRGLMENRDA